MSEFKEEIKKIMESADETSENLPMIPKDDQPDEDYEYAKDKIKKIVEIGEEVLNNASDVAITTGEPRSIEVFSHLLKNMTDAVKSTLDIKKIKKDLDKPVEQPEKNAVGQVTNNTVVFTGTTKELLKKIQEESSAAKIIEHDEIS